MLRRNGALVKIVVAVCVFFGVIYSGYLYNDLSGLQKNTERTAERYRRQQESLSAQLQVQFGHITRLEKALQAEKINHKALLNDIIVAKDEFKQKCDNDKEQMTNRLNSLQQTYKMLKSQHEDMESDFGKLQMEKQKEKDEHNKQDEERALEYSQFKQEKQLEISNLKDSKANLEREKEQNLKQIEEMKSQLQASLKQMTTDKEMIKALQKDVENQKLQLQTDQQTLQYHQNLLVQCQDLVLKAETRQAQAEQQVHQLQLQIQQLGNQQQQQFDNRIQQNVPQIPQQLGHNGNQLQQFDNRMQQNVPQILQQPGQNGNQLHQFNKFLQQNVPQQQLGQKQLQNLGGLQGIDSKNQNVLKFDRNDPGKYMDQGPGGGVGNMADEILKSLQDKHKPLDADLMEQQQKLHQVIPPKDLAKNDLGYEKNQAQKLPGQKGKILTQQQIGKPNFNADHGDHGNKMVVVGADDGNHDGRIENQGPVNLQVQEPVIKNIPEVVNSKQDEGLGKLKHNVPDAVDNQIQPQQHVDDSRRQEQMDVPNVQQGNQQLNGADDRKHVAADDDEDENYDGDFDKANNEKDDDGGDF